MVLHGIFRAAFGQGTHHFISTSKDFKALLDSSSSDGKNGLTHGSNHGVLMFPLHFASSYLNKSKDYLMLVGG